MPKLLTVLLAVSALALTPAVAAASDGHDPDVARFAGQVRVIDDPISAQTYLVRAAASNQFEIVTGQLAQQKAQSPDVKALGALFVAHHTMLQEQGAAVAAELGLTIPVALTPRQQAIVAKLQRLEGEQFDRYWVTAQIRAHLKALALNLRTAERGRAPQVRALAQGALPVVAHHLAALVDLGEDHQEGWDDDHDEDDD